MNTKFFAAAAAALSFAAAPISHSEELTISAWGGFFEETLAEVVYPGFTEATGIKVNSIPQPADQAWLTQIANAARAKQAPADLSLVTETVVLRGQNASLWAELDTAAMANTGALIDGVYAEMDGKTNAVPALAFFDTFVTNTDFSADAPMSWAELWTGDWDGKLALRPNSNSGLLEITAVTFFGGYEIMQTRDGLQQVIDKIAELKPSVSLWYRDEGQFQQGLEAGEYTAGTYYHDVAMLSIWDGLPIASTFPKEGGIKSTAYWVAPAASKHTEAAQKFIDYMSQPEVQEAMALNLGIFPVVPRETMNLSDDDFAAVGSDIAPITLQTEIHLEEGEWLEERFQSMLSN